jgi:hypothetical protein
MGTDNFLAKLVSVRVYQSGSGLSFEAKFRPMDGPIEGYVYVQEPIIDMDFLVGFMGAMGFVHKTKTSTIIINDLIPLGFNAVKRDKNHSLIGRFCWLTTKQVARPVLWANKKDPNAKYEICALKPVDSSCGRVFDVVGWRRGVAG